MSKKSFSMVGLLGLLSLGVLAVVGLVIVSGRSGASMPFRAPAHPAATTATVTPGHPSGEAGSSDPKPSAPLGSSPVAEGRTTDAESDLTLGKDQREYLWQVEHHGLVLSRIGFRRIAEALKQGDASALLSLLADGFEGRRWASRVRCISSTTAYGLFASKIPASRPAA